MAGDADRQPAGTGMRQDKDSKSTLRRIFSPYVYLTSQAAISDK